MATKTIARPRTPVTSPDGSAQDATDCLENTLAQLDALMWTCNGADIDWCTGDGPRHLANLHWLAADLTQKAGELFQSSEKARRVAPETDGA
ncbi:hypothetical protein [Variovorax sp. IB41]|jgi:hypothetical protein|uniref:hypothetical protein n=1 Tax=Variovorax sp. IB41 TaxID=2779370 RepID=UPI0018E70911|nr:hypothetical protein [Variovorax sp. IB41]MBJ2154265.1 hypothetical protein [Variovorax sp. IB41]